MIVEVIPTITKALTIGERNTNTQDISLYNHVFSYFFIFSNMGLFSNTNSRHILTDIMVYKKEKKRCRYPRSTTRYILFHAHSKSYFIFIHLLLSMSVI